MQDSKSLLLLPEFWTFYVLGAGHEVAPELLARFGFDLRKDADRALRFASFVLPVGPGGALHVTVGLEYWDKQLGLEDRLSNRRFSLGWWDEARWHPSGLRYAELLRLRSSWLARPAPISADEAFLLLVGFVGNGEDEADELPERRTFVGERFRSLGLFDEATVIKLADASLWSPEGEGYRWAKHPSLGWTFTGEYPCYSLRNEAHTDAKEGSFPFRIFEDLVESLPT